MKLKEFRENTKSLDENLEIRVATIFGLITIKSIMEHTDRGRKIEDDEMPTIFISLITY